jgi:hypothetical protein
VTCDQYEVFPIADWKARATNCRELVELVRAGHGLQLPHEAELREHERALVLRVREHFQRMS